MGYHRRILISLKSEISLHQRKNRSARHRVEPRRIWEAPQRPPPRSGPTAIPSKLLAVWHPTSREIAHHCGADAAQFFLIEGGSSAILLLATLAIAIMLSLNIYAGKAPISDEFSKTTINHINKG
ncbi:CSC1-like protein [Abeliophyllum distichum]|uniref:CSC1-like protein n=1 Tax=Abeliophyllum distichum TaxID=126358 RepID=A0ABD1QF69_9LAMI